MNEGSWLNFQFINKHIRIIWIEWYTREAYHGTARLKSEGMGSKRQNLNY